MADLTLKQQQEAAALAPKSAVPGWLSAGSVPLAAATTAGGLIKGLFDAAAARKRRQQEILTQGTQGQASAVQEGVEGQNAALARLMARL